MGDGIMRFSNDIELEKCRQPPYELKPNQAVVDFAFLLYESVPLVCLYFLFGLCFFCNAINKKNNPDIEFCRMLSVSRVSNYSLTQPFANQTLCLFIIPTDAPRGSHRHRIGLHFVLAQQLKQYNPENQRPQTSGRHTSGKWWTITKFWMCRAQPPTVK